MQVIKKSNKVSRVEHAISSVLLLFNLPSYPFILNARPPAYYKLQKSNPEKGTFEELEPSFCYSTLPKIKIS
jgi:hypothetical protein